MSDRQTTLAEVINAAVDSGLKDLYTCIPAKVVKWDAGKLRADCQILVKNVTEAEDGSREVESWPVVPGVVVQFVGAGDYRITCPISDGSGGTSATIGLLMFAHRSLDKWLSGTGGEVDPELDADHNLADAVFLPGLRPFGSTWQDVPSAWMSIGKDGGLQAKFDDDLIVFAAQSGNAQFVALANLVKQRLDTIQSKFDSHTHVVSYNAGTTPSSATSAVPSSAIGALADVAASKVKAE